MYSNGLTDLTEICNEGFLGNMHHLKKEEKKNILRNQTIHLEVEVIHKIEFVKNELLHNNYVKRTISLKSKINECANFVSINQLVINEVIGYFRTKLPNLPDR